MLSALIQLETMGLIQGALRVRILAHDLTSFWIKPYICPRKETYTCASSTCALEKNMKSFSILWQTEGSYTFAIQKKLFLINSMSKQLLMKNQTTLTWLSSQISFRTELRSLIHVQEHIYQGIYTALEIHFLMWIKLTFMCKTPREFPVCEVRISPSFSRVPWSCNLLPQSPPARQSMSAAGQLDGWASPLPTGTKRCDVLFPHRLTAQALLGCTRRAPPRFCHFPWGVPLLFSSSLAFKRP